MDAHSDLQRDASVEDDFKGFLVRVSPVGEIPLVRQGSFLIKPGSENYLGISAYNTKSNNIYKIKPKDRGCLYHDEMKLKFHKRYTQANCMLECKVSIAMGTLGCHPWFFPSPDGTINFCDPWQSREFLRLTGKVSKGACSHCISDCDSNLYKMSLSSAPFR